MVIILYTTNYCNNTTNFHQKFISAKIGGKFKIAKIPLICEYVCRLHLMQQRDSQTEPILAM